MTLSRLTSSGAVVIDSRNKISKPRLNLQAAVAGIAVASGGGGDSGDIPLPLWAHAMLGSGLLAAIDWARQTNRQR